MRLSSSRMGEITFKFLALTFIFSILGCVSSKSLTTIDKASIQSVSIAEDVFLPERMYYQGPRESILIGVGGLLGSLAAESGRADTEELFKYVMKKENINISQIVRDEFKSRLQNLNMYKIIASSNESSYKFKLMIKVYGFAQYQGLSKQLKPMLGVEGTLESSDSKVLWKKYAYITPLNGTTPSHTYEEYMNNPNFMLEAFSSASKIVIADLIESLK